MYQSDRGGAAYVPLDVGWGMQGEYATPAVQECVLFGMAHLTAKEVERFLEKSSMFHPSEKAIKNMVSKSGDFIEAHIDELNEGIRGEETIPEATAVVVASMDGVNVLLRETGQKSGRPKERPGEKQEEVSASSYKNAMVGSISFYGYSQQRGRPPLCGKKEATEKEEVKPVRLCSHYIARMPESYFPAFKQQFEAELDDIEKAVDATVKRVLLNDGHRVIWNYIDNNERFDDYEKLVDFYHASEHLSKAAEAIFGKKSKAGDEWYHKWYDNLQTEDHAAKAVLRSMNYYAKILKIPKTRLEDLKREQTFFRRNHHRMNYADFIRQGLPIGSGPVEAACKSVVKNRMCRSGMRWSRKGGQQILNLRAYAKADRWEKFWNNYKQLKQAA
ncbi:MAG: hypothetical protein R3333_14340 [Lishizhenia sp.]|nr:hypothetical protein [Lishizhenia sp.]